MAQHVAVKLDKAMTHEQMAETLNKALIDYDKGIYDAHIRKAYCSARRRYNYGDIIKQYLEPGLVEYEREHRI